MTNVPPAYEPPELTVHGPLGELTRSTSIHIGRQVFQLAAVLSLGGGGTGKTTSTGVQGVSTGGSFPSGTGTGSIPGAVQGVSTSGTVPTDTVTHAVQGVSTTGVIPGAGGARDLASAASSGGDSGLAGRLPFTGAAAGATAGVGAMMALTGGWLRYTARRMSRSSS
jgi:hypothetical protein